MASETRGRGRGSGCWTCRLRRKKCDEARPKCRNCTSLEITCHGGATKPIWMDGGARQSQMMAKIKAQVKRRADTRRERHSGGQVSVDDSAGGGHRDFIVQSREDFDPKTSRPRQTPRQVRATSDSGIGSSSNTEAGTMGDPFQFQPNENFETLLMSTLEAARIRNPTSATDASGARWSSSALGFLDDVEEIHHHQPILSRGRDFEIDFLMKYLDYVFPYMFPFYQPSLHETGRSWVLALLRRSRVAFHSAMSLSAYFFTFTLIDGIPGQHDFCKEQLWEKVARQTDICFEMIQHDIQDLRLRGAQATLLEKVRVMESITQFLIFEVALSRSAEWNLHLTPTLALFEEIWQSVPAEGADSKLFAVLDAMTLPLWYGLEPGGFVWSPEQSGFRFFTGLLIFIDIVASTALAQRPRLSEHHPHLLHDLDRGEPDLGMVPLQISSLVGCQNWVMIAISQIAELDVWKKDMKRASKLSMIQLVNRASQISRALDDGLSHLDKPTITQQRQDGLIFRSYVNGRPSTSSRPSATPTQIWARAAQIYLAVVVSGWQPSNEEIRSSVSQILDLFQQVKISTYMQTLSWPLCVAGCLAEAGSHEQEFRGLFASMDELCMVGAMGEARKVMERVWEDRETLNPETWDLAACFSVLGAPVLLV